MRIRNEDIEGLVVEVPEGHLHLRTFVRLRDGTELEFQEAAVANLRSISRKEIERAMDKEVLSVLTTCQAESRARG